ncbi:MAG: hypothetical protein JXR07_17890 [Reichenbachiella sp.]
MLRVIVLSLMYIGSANMFTENDFKRTLKKAIKDKGKESSVLKKVDGYSKTQAAYEKSLMMKLGEFQVMYDADNVTQAGMIEYFDEVEEMYENYYTSVVNQRVELASLLSTAEWTAIQVRYKKQHKEIRNARKKRVNLLESEIAKVKKSFATIEQDSLQLAKIDRSVDEIKLAFNLFYDASNKLNFVDNKVLFDQNSTKEEIETVYHHWDNVRAAFYDQLILETEEMSVYLTEDEWNLFIKDLKGKF